MIDEEHDLLHMMTRARQWFVLCKKIFKHAEEWFDEMDKKMQKMMEKKNDNH